MPRGAAPPAAERRARGKRSEETENQVRRVYFVLSQTTRVHDTRRKGSRGLPPGSRVFSSGSRGPSRPSAGSMKPDPTRSTETASPGTSHRSKNGFIRFLSGGKIRRVVPRALARSLASALLPPRRPDPPARAETRPASRPRGGKSRHAPGNANNGDGGCRRALEDDARGGARERGAPTERQRRGCARGRERRRTPRRPERRAEHRAAGRALTRGAASSRGPGEFRSQSTPIKRRDATRPRGEAAARARRV